MSAHAACPARPGSPCMPRFPLSSSLCCLPCSSALSACTTCPSHPAHPTHPASPAQPAVRTRHVFPLAPRFALALPVPIAPPPSLPYPPRPPYLPHSPQSLPLVPLVCCACLNHPPTLRLALASLALLSCALLLFHSSCLPRSSCSPTIRSPVRPLAHDTVPPLPPLRSCSDRLLFGQSVCGLASSIIWPLLARPSVMVHSSASL